MLVIISGILHINTINATTIASINNALFILIPPKTKKCAAEATHRKMHNSELLPHNITAHKACENRACIFTKIKTHAYCVQKY